MVGHQRPGIPRRQDRIGVNGRTFKMYKFRTMKTVPKTESDTRWGEADEGRITTIGGWLRRTSFDELPQLFKVVKGDMNVVGPRPERPYFVEKFLDEISSYSSRHRLKGGITGWAQVNGWRGNTSIEKRIECDLYYLRNWSLAFDARILLMTAFAIFANRRASTPVGPPRW